VNELVFSPDGRVFATADDDGTAQLWNAATGQPAGAPLPASTGPGASVNAMAFSPDGKLLATAGSDGTLKFWNRAPEHSCPPGPDPALLCLR
jgi:WD40 repeat protein